MVFLGKIALDSGGKRLAVTPTGKLAMQQLRPDDPAGLFLAYDVGGGWFSLQCYQGSWVQLLAAKSPIAWYPVLYSAGVVPGRNEFTSFSRRLFDMPGRKLGFVFHREDSGEEVALTFLGDRGNPYCSCEFDVYVGGDGTQFEMTVLAPGVEELDRTRSGAGGDYRCIGSACVDLSNVSLSWVSFRNADFSGANLRGATLYGCDLGQAKLEATDLTGATLAACNATAARLVAARLARADLSQATVEGADFSSCDLTDGTRLPPPPLANSAALRTIFRDARLPAALLERDWSFLDLSGAELTGLNTADLRGLVARDVIAPGLDLAGQALQDADFSNADLTGARFDRADVTGGRFHSAVLTNGVFAQAKLRGASFAPDPSRPGAPSTDLGGARFNHADLTAASLRQALLSEALFTAANMAEVDLSAAQLGGQGARVAASLSYAFLENARLDHAILSGVSFRYVSLFGARASARSTVTMERVDFTNAYVAGLDLSGADLRGARFTNACLVNAKLEGVNLQRSIGAGEDEVASASLAGATLQGVAFRGANLDFADLSNAAVAFIPDTIPVRFCNAENRPDPTPPAVTELVFQPTRDLDLNTLGEDTICPNGFTVRQNRAAGRSVTQMLTSANAPTSWFPSACGPARDDPTLSASCSSDR